MKRKVCDSDFIKIEATPTKRQPFAPLNHSAMYNTYQPPGDRTSPPGPPSPSPSAEAELRRVMDNFVSIYEQLDTCGGPGVKPNYSYTELAYLAMLRAPNFCLPITEIYRYIQSRFLFFKNSTRKHWKNAVRHSLAKTLCFSKIPVGRGTSNSETLSRSTYLWCIMPGSISSFARGDYRPSVDRDSGTNTLRWGYYRVNAGKFWDEISNYVAKKMQDFKTGLLASSDQARIFETQVCSLPRPGPHQQPQTPPQPPLQSGYQHRHPRHQPYQSTPNPHVHRGTCRVDGTAYMRSPADVTRPAMCANDMSPPPGLLRFDAINPSIDRTSPLLDRRVTPAEVHGAMAHSPTLCSDSDRHDPWIGNVELINVETDVPSIEQHRFTPPFASSNRHISQFTNTSDPYTPLFTLPRQTSTHPTTDRHTPSLLPGDYPDSGADTCVSSPENSSYDHLPSCQQSTRNHSSPLSFPTVTFDKFTDDGCFDNLELSPLLDSGFLNISDILPQSFSQSSASDSGCSSLNFDSPCATNGFQYQYVFEPADFVGKLASPVPVAGRVNVARSSSPCSHVDVLPDLKPMFSYTGFPAF